MSDDNTKKNLRRSRKTLLFTGHCVLPPRPSSTDGQCPRTSFLTSHPVPLSSYRCPLPIAALALALSLSGAYPQDSAAPQEQQIYDFTLSQPSCTRTANQVKCTLLVANTESGKNNEIKFEKHWYGDEAVATDDEGHQYPVIFPMDSYRLPGFEKPKPVRASFVIENVPTAVKSLSFNLIALEHPEGMNIIGTQNPKGKPRDAKFQDIPIVNTPALKVQNTEPEPTRAENPPTSQTNSASTPLPNALDSEPSQHKPARKQPVATPQTQTSQPQVSSQPQPQNSRQSTFDATQPIVALIVIVGLTVAAIIISRRKRSNATTQTEIETDFRFIFSPLFQKRHQASITAAFHFEPDDVPPGNRLHDAVSGALTTLFAEAQQVPGIDQVKFAVEQAIKNTTRNKQRNPDFEIVDYKAPTQGSSYGSGRGLWTGTQT
jgi:hypothetical protein